MVTSDGNRHICQELSKVFAMSLLCQFKKHLRMYSVWAVFASNVVLQLYECRLGLGLVSDRVARCGSCDGISASCDAL